MTAWKVADLGRHIGERIHVGPHDIYRNRDDGDPIRKNTRDGDVTVDALEKLETIGIIVCHDQHGSQGAAVYDLDDTVERAS